MDFIIYLPVSMLGTEEYNAILIVVNRYTKIAIFLFIKDTIDIVEITKLLYIEIKLRYEYSSKIVSNRDLRITSKF